MTAGEVMGLIGLIALWIGMKAFAIGLFVLKIALVVWVVKWIMGW